MKLCKCGCGKATTIITKTIREKGRIKGEYNDYMIEDKRMDNLINQKEVIKWVNKF